MFTIYSADVTGNPGNCSYPHKHIILDEDSLKAAVCHDYVCAEYKNSYRNGDNFIGSDCLPVDCDNDHSENPEDWITPEDVLQAFPGVTFAVHYSRFNNRVKNGKPARPKFHVLFPIDYVTDATFYSNMKKLVNSIFPYFDTKALDAARFFFGTIAADVALYPGRMNLTEYLNEDIFDEDMPDSDMPKSPNRGNSRLEECVMKIIDLEEQITEDMEKLVNLKKEITHAIQSVSNPEYQDLLAKRYICCESWEKIAVDMNYELRYIHKLHSRALQEVKIPESNEDGHEKT